MIAGYDHLRIVEKIIDPADQIKGPVAR